MKVKKYVEEDSLLFHQSGRECREDIGEETRWINVEKLIR